MNNEKPTPAAPSYKDSRHQVAIIAFIAGIVAYHLVYSPFFLSASVGHDYSLILPQLLENYYWILKNGMLSINWFSPGFCGGQPAFADPQNIQFSLPQWLTLIMPPIKAVYGTVLIFAALGYWGMYWFLARVLSLCPGLAVTGAILFMFNSFFAGRMMIGHLTFHGIMLLPLMACFLLHRTQPRQWLSEALLAIGGGLTFAYWGHSGMIHLIIPAAIVLLGLAGMVLVERPIPVSKFFMRWAIAALLGIALFLGKLLAGMAYLKNFPRSDYSLPAFSSPWQEILAIGRSLFLQPGNVAENYSPYIVHLQWSLDLHEWMFGISPLPIILLLACLMLRWQKNPQPSLEASATIAPKTSTLRIYLGWGIFLSMALIPLIINWAPSLWQEFFKTIPIIKSSSNLFRWWLADMVLLLVASLFLAEKNHLLNRAQGWPVALAAALALSWQIASFDRAFFAGQPYNPTPTTLGWEDARRQGFTPKIKVNAVHIRNGRIVTPLNRNDAFMAGGSTILCYNPIFGYRLEKLPIKSLVPGPVDKLGEGVFNIKNPACYMYPEENSCTPGDHFKAAQKTEMESFVAYKPFRFAVSRTQHTANLIAIGALLSLLFFAIGAIICKLKKRKTKCQPLKPH